MAGTTASLQGNITNNAALIFDQTLPASPIASGTYAGVISGSGSVTKNNAGTVIFTNVNTYNGVTTINGGTLQLGDGTNNNANVGGGITLAGGALKYNYNGANFGVGNAITLTANSTIGSMGPQINLTGTFNGGGKVLTIDNGANPNYFYFNGGFGSALSQVNIVNGFAAEDGGAGTPLRTAAMVISSGAAFATFSNITVNNNITLNGGAGPNGNGVLQNEGNGTATYSGTISLNSGNSSVGTVGGNINLTNTISGTGSLTKTAANVLTLTAAGNYSGTTTITAGTLQLGNGGVSGSLSGTTGITNNGMLVVNRNNPFLGSVDLHGAGITGTGGFTQSGSGTTTLDVANSFTGATVISNGQVSASVTGSLGSGTSGTASVAIANTATLLLTGSGNLDRVRNDAAINLGGGTVAIASGSSEGTAATVSRSEFQHGQCLRPGRTDAHCGELHPELRFERHFHAAGLQLLRPRRVYAQHHRLHEQPFDGTATPAPPRTTASSLTACLTTLSSRRSTSATACPRPKSRSAAATTKSARPSLNPPPWCTSEPPSSASLAGATGGVPQSSPGKLRRPEFRGSTHIAYSGRRGSTKRHFAMQETSSVSHDTGASFLPCPPVRCSSPSW